MRYGKYFPDSGKRWALQIGNKTGKDGKPMTVADENGVIYIFRTKVQATLQAEEGERPIPITVSIEYL